MFTRPRRTIQAKVKRMVKKLLRRTPPPKTLPPVRPNLGVQANEFGFTITGTSNLVIVVEACTDLANPVWSPLGTNTLIDGSSYLYRAFYALPPGSIAIGGQDMTGVDPSRRGIGMVFQSYALYPTMTVEKNMSFGLRIAGLPKAEIARRVVHTAGLLQLDALGAFDVALQFAADDHFAGAYLPLSDRRTSTRPGPGAHSAASCPDSQIESLTFEFTRRSARRLVTGTFSA